MILVDSSAWIGFLRGLDSPVVERLEGLIGSGAELAITEPIIMELLAGAKRPRELARVDALTNGLLLAPLVPMTDFRDAAELYRASSANGHPIRSMTDCLIAAVAIRRGLPIVHDDRDFTFLAEISPLRLDGAE
ncbi:Ribonuclease VapC11 [Microbacterium oxydans]|uniref:Ribonuclease VapC n=1 Tax=Microbacterium oxydans TaxID=82380 RepID=A0A0F0KMD1_9MICO|nr:PIN domain nuclease [Microbacterium oxydans]KJL22057.1 Ribonuclease VapC11 [Microbacterium oxydans]